MKIDLGEVLDPFRRHVIDINDALPHARYRYDGLDLILETVSDSKVRGASQEIFAVAGEKMNVVDDMLDELYRQLSDVDRMLEGYASEREWQRARPVRGAIVDAVTNAGRVIALIDIFGRKRSRIRGETAHPRGMD